LIRFLLPALLIASTLSAAEIDKAPAAVSGKEATFVQRFTPKGFKNAQVESGTVIFGTLPQMRWSYSRPEQKLFVERYGYTHTTRPELTVLEMDNGRFMNHSDDPNTLAASWHDIWLAA